MSFVFPSELIDLFVLKKEMKVHNIQVCYL